MRRYFSHDSLKLFFFIFLASIDHFTFSLKIFDGPPGYSHYQTGSVVEICSYNNRLKQNSGDISSINLNHGLIISSRNEFSYGYPGEDWICQFVVESQWNEKIVASVQSMAFEEQDDCTSYVEFSDGNYGSTDKMCGYYRNHEDYDFWEKFNSRYPYSNPFNNSEVNYGAYSNDGKITTKIVIADGKSVTEALAGLMIVYTSYGVNGNDVYYGEEQLPPYGISMRKEYICDGIRNCHGLCRDEENCSMSKKWITIIIISSAIIFSTIIGIFNCWKFKFLCWSTSNTRTSPPIHLRPNGVPANLAAHAVYGGNVPHDFECPPTPDSLPTYDSLFPEQTNHPSTR